MSLAINLFEISWYFAFLICIRHSLKTNGKSRTAYFFLPLFSLVLIAEEVASSVFHGFYYPNYLVYVLHVPVAILLGWCAITYLAYRMSKVMCKQGSTIKISFFAAVFGIIIDLFLEPLAYFFRLWVWNRPDVYFNASFENFISWFVIIFAFTIVFDRVDNTMMNAYKKFFVMQFSVLGIIALLFLAIIGWKATINL